MVIYSSIFIFIYRVTDIILELSWKWKKKLEQQKTKKKKNQRVLSVLWFSICVDASTVEMEKNPSDWYAAAQ